MTNPNSERPEQDRHFTHGTSGALADAATDGVVKKEDHAQDAPHAKRIQPGPADEVPDQLADKEAVSENRDEARLDEGVEESFPASDPLSAHHIT